MGYLTPQGLAGAYGDVFWNLTPAVMYVPGTEIPCIVYVANPTDEDREYMLVAVMIREGVTLIEYPIRVDDLVWFPVEANNVISLPGAMIMGYSDCALTLSLYEKEQNKIVDTVSTALTTAGAEALPGLPGLPELPGLPGLPGVPGGTTGIINMIMNAMIMIMVVIMMTKMMRQQ